MPGDVVTQTFADVTRSHRAQVQAYCYRLLGSADLAAERVQEVFQRAWRTPDPLAARHGTRAWLYRIATETCLHTLAGAVPDRQPFPDALLDPAEDPATIALPFLHALRRLPPRQRAVYVLRDVLDFPPEVIAAVLDSSVTATASALQRARATIRPALPPAGSQLPDPAAVPSFARAYEQADPTELLLCLTEDATLTIEPPGTVVHGREPVAKALLTDIGVPGPRRLLPTVANGRPSVAVYTGLPDAPALRPSAIVVLTATAGEVATLDAFTDPGLFRTFGLPPVLPARSRTAQPW